MMAELEKMPDDACEICGERRDRHGDKNHFFSDDGELRPLKPGEPPRQEAPRPAGSPPAGVENRNPDSAQAFARLMDVMVRKGLLGAEELLYIFGGIDRAPGQ
jgi:hypothetical protein